VAELVQAAKAQPGKISIASAGNGTLNHLIGEMLQKAAGIQLTHVPYKGAAAAVTDVIGGQVQLAFGTMASVLPFIESGKLRALGIAGQAKAAALPQLPTFGEAGFKNYEASLWYSLLAPAKTPRPVIDKLNAAVVEALKTPQVQERLTKQGFETRSSTPEESKQLLDKELLRWAKLVSDLNLKIEQ
jgi:tripartite-type tricarboxylate transporter receptor subunit TctC